MAKKKSTKKAEPKKAAPKKAAVKKVEEPKVQLVTVLRFNVKDGERYKMEVPADEVLMEVNGDAGLKDIVLE
tara:strand:- start:8236 stop:8451 length:216 start_codon:yes stop_codon:yes gene_type:complete